MTSPVHSYRFGDHLKIKRRFYYHHGIYIGNNKVIHYAPPPGKGVVDGIGIRQIFGIDSEINTIHITDLKYFELEQDAEATVIKYNDAICYPPLRAVARAYSRIGENGYNLWGNNCIHFVEWCKLVHHAEHGSKVWDTVVESTLGGLGAGRKSTARKALTKDKSKKKYSEILSKAPAQTSSHDEFLSFATSLYFNLVSEDEPFPLGCSLRHSNQAYDHPIPTKLADDNFRLLFLYEGGLFKRDRKKDWYITERSIVQPAVDKNVNLHDIAKILPASGKIIVTDRDGQKNTFPVRYADPASVAQFISSAISGISISKDIIRINLAARIKQFFSRKRCLQTNGDTD